MDREEKKEKERATDTESSRSKGRSEVGSSTPSTGSSGSRKERKNRDRGDRERERSRDREKEKEKEKDNRRERISREEIRRLQKRLGLSRADSAEFQTPAALRRQLRLEAKKKLKLKAALKETKRSDKTQRDRDDDEEDITRRDRKDKESSSSKSRSKSRSLKDRRHRTSHSARNSPQPEAPPSLPSSSAEPADPVSTKYRKPSAHTSSAVAHNRDSREEDKHSAVKPSSTRSSSSGSAKDHSKHLKSDRIEKESERIPVGKSGSTIPSPTIAVAKSSQFSPSRTTTTTTTPSTSKRSDHSSVKRRHSESHNHSHHHHHNHTHTHTHDADHRKEHHQLDSHHRRRKQHKHKHTSSAHDQDTPSIDESFESRSNTTSPQRSHKSTTRSSKKMSDKRVESGEDVSPINSQSGVSNQTNTSESSSDKMEGIEPTNTETTSSAPSNLGGVESHLLPSIDIQIQQVMDFVQRPIAEFQKGYLVSSKWLNRVLARSNDKTYLANKTIAKDATEGEIGPIDNSDLVLDAPQLKGIKHTDGQEYIPLKPNLTMGVDFEVLPEDAWHLIVRWYGVKPGTPVIVREAHNTAVDTTTMENIQYELRPPVFTVLKLSHTPTTACGSDRAPVMVVASRHMSFNSWLKCVKQKAGIPISTKVRVWRIIKNDVVTASTPSSRSSTPAPDNSNNLPSSFKTNLVVPVTAFKSLEEDSQRELLDAKDQTANEKYNGKASVDQYGLGGEEETIVLEEQLGGKVWCTEVSAAKAAHFTGAATPGVPTGKKDKGDDSSSSGTKVNSRSDSSSANSNNSGNSGPVKSHKELRKEEKEKRKQKEKEKESSGIRRRKDGKTVGVTGLVNLGNTCYMNSALQCIRSVEELTRYFLADNYKGDLNPSNPLGHDGNVARAYANLLHQIFDVNASSAFAPRQFKNVIGRYGPSFSGYGQQDSQEFIMFLLDGLQEDLNRIQKKPYIEKPDSTDDMVNNKAKLVAFAEEHWRIYKARNDSVVTDLFAGMYKSTLHCPECDKVSIIFDPFSNLTLQLPIENTWSHNLTFFPLYGKPISMDIEIEKNSTVKALKAHVAKKLGMPEDAVSRLIFTEVYNSRFYRMFDNQVSLADAQIESSDEVAMFEVESVPTSYSADFHRANQGYRSMLFSSRRDEDAQLAGDFKSPKGDRILVPIYNRVLPPKSNNNYARPTLKGHPGYVVINREEAYDYDAILKKVLACVANLTTRDILGEAAAELENEKVKGLDKKSDEMDTDDAVDLGAEMTEDNGDDKVKAESIKSEDGIVDVSMTDAPSSKTTLVGQIPYVCRPGVFVPGALQNIFEMRYHQSNEACPTSIGNEAQNFRSLTSRLPRSRSSSRNSSSSRVGRQQGPASLASPSATDDEATRPTLERTTTITHSEVGSDSDSGKTMPVDEKDRASSSASNRSNSTSRSRSGSRFSKFRRALKEKKDRPRVPLIRPGEAIILDWTDEVFDALFGASRATKDGLRGSPTWVNPEVFDDPELKAKRIQRRRLRNHGITLDDCLDEFGREEILSENDAWYCPRCKTHRRASKKFELWRTPDILVMHLKRFSSNRILRDKLDTFVDFPHELDMSDRVVHPEPGKSQKYELIAVDNHYGGLGGGHYTAYAKNFIDGNWYDFNGKSWFFYAQPRNSDYVRLSNHPTDSSVHRIEPSKAVTRSAYLLFYRRKSEKPLGGPILEEMVTRSRMENDSSSSDSESDDSTSNRGSNSRHGGISLSRNVSSKFSPNSYSLDPILCLGPFRREEAVNAQRRQRFNLRLPGQGYEQAHGSLLDGDIAQPYSPKMPGSYISPPSIIEGDEQEFPMVKKRARAPEIFGPTFLGDEPDPDDGTTKHDQAYQQDVKSSDGSSSSTALTTTATTPPTPPPFPTKPSRIYNPKQRDIVEHAHHAHAHPRRNTSPDSNLITPSAQAKQIPGLDRENIVLPKSSGVPMVRSTASIGVPAKVEGGSDDRSPLRDLTSTPTWSFSKSLSSPAGMVDSNIASDAQDTSDIPGSFPTKEVNDDDMKKEGGLKEPTYDHVLNDMAADDDSDDEMPTQELEI